ncbi:hypothetical protein A3K73_01290 [Candidatus Pacearchaeota archaeon RBG_13_36_9]|nr:MAG: hypothetical protein A3K73_01290 [Candidatus Pacearchaeota archaeon RBG_13_36_9]
MEKSGKTAVIVSVLIALILVTAFVFAKPEPRAAKICSDGLDNDGDGYIDYPDDPGCYSKNDNSELNTAIECDDGSDNDGDSAIDMADAGCASPTDNDESNCGDSVCEGVEACDACVADCGYCDSCSDTDGNNPRAFGTTSGYFDKIFYSDDDYCVDSSNVMEYWCSGNYEQNTQQSCGTDYGSNVCYFGDVYYNSTDYYCSSGKCNADYDILTLVEECYYGCTNGECNHIPDSCYDTDGWSILTMGNVSGYNNEQWYVYEDSCNGTYVNEWTCYFNEPYLQSPLDCSGNYTTCVDGACV